MVSLKTSLLALAVALISLSARAADLGVAHIGLLDGDVQVKTQDGGEWLPAALNMPLAGGDRLWVPARGRVEVRLRDGSYVRLNEHSALEILTLERDSFQFYLTAGQGYVNFKGRRDYFLQLDTPVAALRVYDKAVFRVDVSDNSDTHVSVIKGAVEAENRHDRLRVSAGKTLLLRADARPERIQTAAPDEWERWNAWRDHELYERRESARYLPDELDSYAYDLDTHGRWVNSADYGYVWIPSVHVSVGWSPYRVGRWVWIGGDYVWISHEPWGWAPYHYGRWNFDARLGWCWVPPLRGAVHWGPGFVGWSQHHHHVAWVPLAPGEIYYGHGHYGPHSVNLLHVDFHKTHVKHHYKNAHVHNGVTTLHRDSFLTGRPAQVSLKENLFLTAGPRLGRPDIAPEHTTRLPTLKDIPRAHLPPSTIRDLPVRELKEARPLVKDRSAPAFRGEARERAAPVTATPTREQTLGQPKPTEPRTILRPTERAPEAHESKTPRSFGAPAVNDKPRAIAPAPQLQETPVPRVREAKPTQPLPQHDPRPIVNERRPETSHEAPRLKEIPRATDPGPAAPRVREALPVKPAPHVMPAPERHSEHVREIKRSPEAAGQRSAPVQPHKDKPLREEPGQGNEGVKFR